MNQNLRFTLITGAAAALVLGSMGVATAQEATPATQEQQHQTRTGKDQTQPAGQGSAVQSGQVSQRRQGRGDGVGNQGASPADGTGNGSPGRLGNRKTDNQPSTSGAMKGTSSQKASEKSAKKAQKNGTGKAGAGGKGSSDRSRSRMRDLSGTGSGTCAGSGSGGRLRIGGSGGGRRK